MSNPMWKTDVKSMLDKISDIEFYINGRTIEHLTTEKMFKDAILMSLFVIGETSKQVPLNFRGQFADNIWINISNSIADEYFDVDLNLIWDIATNEIPRLKSALEKLLREEK